MKIASNMKNLQNAIEIKHLKDLDLFLQVKYIQNTNLIHFLFVCLFIVVPTILMICQNSQTLFSGYLKITRLQIIKAL